MAVKLLGGTIRKQLAKHLGKHVLAGTLIKVTAGARGATVSAGTTPTETSYSCRLWVSTYDAQEMAGTSIRSSDRKISILGGTLAAGIAPAPNDKIIAEGVTYRIVGDPGSPGVKRDPDGAKYTCHARA